MSGGSDQLEAHIGLMQFIRRNLSEEPEGILMIRVGSVERAEAIALDLTPAERRRVLITITAPPPDGVEFESR